MLNSQDGVVWLHDYIGNLNSITKVKKKRSIAGGGKMVGDSTTHIELSFRMILGVLLSVTVIVVLVVLAVIVVDVVVVCYSVVGVDATKFHSCRRPKY